MANFNVVVPHEVDRVTAVDRIQSFSETVRSAMPDTVSNLEETWDDHGNLEFAFQAMGFKISGSLKTCEDNITVDGKLPFAALPFRGMIESELASRIREAIA